VAAAKTAVLAQLEPFRRLLFVFKRVVVAALALRARHHNYHTIIFFCHFKSLEHQRADTK
jgi:hypothetical protein